LLLFVFFYNKPAAQLLLFFKIRLKGWVGRFSDGNQIWMAKGEQKGRGPVTTLYACPPI